MRTIKLYKHDGSYIYRGKGFRLKCEDYSFYQNGKLQLYSFSRSGVILEVIATFDNVDIVQIIDEIKRI